MDIVISVANRVATPPSNAVIVCGNSEYNIVFDFDAEWQEENSKTARFVWFVKNKAYSKEIPFEGDTVAVPILSNANAVHVGVYAGNLRTTTPAKIVCERSILCYGSDSERAPDSLAQIKGQIAELAKALRHLAENPVEGLPDETEQLTMLIEADMLPAAHDLNGKILTDESGRIVLRY